MADPSLPEEEPRTSASDQRKGQRAILWLIIITGIAMALPPILYFFFRNP